MAAVLHAALDDSYEDCVEKYGHKSCATSGPFQPSAGAVWSDYHGFDIKQAWMDPYQPADWVWISHRSTPFSDAQIAAALESNAGGYQWTRVYPATPGGGPMQNTVVNVSQAIGNALLSSIQKRSGSREQLHFTRTDGATAFVFYNTMEFKSARLVHREASEAAYKRAKEAAVPQF